MTNTKREIGNLKLFTGNANPELAQEIAEYLGVKLGAAKVKHFSDGEISLIIDESVRGCDAYIIQPTCSPVNDNLMELLIMTDALRRASASRITAVLPYYGYARQDRKSRGREPITAKLVANMITEAGASRLLAMDLHAMQIQGFFDMPVDNLFGLPILAEYFKHKDRENLVVVSPDMGGVARARNLAEQIGVPLAIIDKRRPMPNVSEVMNIIGDIEGKEVILVDDMIATAGTVTHGAQSLIDHLLVDTLEDCRHEACVDCTTYDTVVVHELTAPWKVKLFLTLDIEDNFLSVNLEAVTWIHTLLIRSDKEMNLSELTCST